MEQGQDGPDPAQSLEHAELEPEPKLDPKSQPEPKVDPKSQPGPGAESVPDAEPGLGADLGPASERGPGSERGPASDLGPGSERGPASERGPSSYLGPGSERGPGSEPGSDWQRQQRIASRRTRVDVRRREALGEEVEKEEEEEEEEEQRKSLRVIQETGKVLAKLLFHGTQLVTKVRVEADLRESRRREKEGEEKRRRLEKLEAEAKQGSEKLAEINSKWALAADLKIPQELWELLEQREECERLLAGKNRLILELQQELEAKDSEYEQALRAQAGEIRELLQRMEEQTRNMVRNYRNHLRNIEETLEEERREMLESNRRRWNEAMQAHSEQELQLLRAQLERALDFERLLSELEAESLESSGSLKFQLQWDVQYLEKKLRQMKGIFHLNQVKLEYNLDVLRQLDVENSTLRSMQKRKINRLQTSLSLLRAKLSNQEKKFQEEKQSLESELARITEQFQETRSRMRDLARSRAEEFRRVWLVNEEEAKALLRRALDADRLIHAQQLGIPWEEPRPCSMDTVGPPGARQEKREAMEVVMEMLEGIPSGKRDQGGRRTKKKGRKEKQEKAKEGSTSQKNVSRETLGNILELLSQEAEFLVENKLLRPLRAVVGSRKSVQQLGSILETLRIEDEDELRKLLEFFLYYGRQGGRDIQETPTENPPDLDEDGENSRKSQFQREDPKSLEISIPTPSIEADDVLKILKEFLRDFPKLRAEGPAMEIQDIRDNSKDGEFWESLAHAIPEGTLKLWDALGAALLEYHKVLTRRSELISEAAALQRQNSELGILLQEFLGSEQGP